ncbi:MAG: flagellar motor protein MotA [Alphaproteobacteria bacterium]|nr:flagellar motor protein MotA [Alphaproteobacteria bacterium]MBU0798046.1 flagellar motor protein MotA [Alphaproteobacteria bacterium]MBU0888746.1 flagellar motor protein MotA [Alphaproteobacteria bacterium]MBU1812535.1 flagellar motor protein MotA [Alphaproteobacteria bacterium]
MSTPKRFLTRMVVFLVAVAVAAALLFPTLRTAFMTSPILNGMIIAVLLLGIVYIFRQVLMLGPEAAWVDSYRRGGAATTVQRQPRLLGPIATLLQERQGRISLSAMTLRSLLDGISSRLDESRDLSRYLVGLLIFLGLLGTFWGLIQTIDAVSRVISNLSFAGGDLGTVFQELQSNLESPLAGMGTAFSSSLFGLSGSLILGFLDLQAGQAQNRFFNDLEDWLSSLTRLGSASPVTEGETSMPVYVQALLEQTADTIDRLQRTIERGEESRRSANNNLGALTEKLSMLTDQMRVEQSLMQKIAEGQMELRQVLVRLAEGSGFGTDEQTRAHIRNMELYLARLLEETSSGRNQAIEEIRSEIRLLARTIAAIAEESQR